MAVQYDGKSPGKLWKFWQKTKALAQTPFQYSTARDAQRMGKDAGISIGAAAVTSLVLGIHIIAALPVVPMLISVAGFSACATFGWRAIQKARGLSQSGFVSGYVRKKEDQWLDNKKNGNVFQRALKSVKDKVSGITSKIPLPLVKAGKWLGFAAAAVGAVAATGGALSYAGVPAFSTGATATAVLGGIAHAGAIVGLSAAAAVATVTGVAVLAIPLGFVAASLCRKAAYARDPDRPVFRKPSSAPKPISEGQVFKPKAASFDFNPPAANTSGPDTSALDEQRRKAAEQRAANRARGGRVNKFN